MEIPQTTDRPKEGCDEMNAVLLSAAALVTVVALLRVGAALMQPILYLFPTSSSGTSPQLSGRRRRR